MTTTDRVACAKCGARIPGESLAEGRCGACVLEDAWDAPEPCPSCGSDEGSRERECAVCQNAVATDRGMCAECADVDPGVQRGGAMTTLKKIGISDYGPRKTNPTYSITVGDLEWIVTRKRWVLPSPGWGWQANNGKRVLYFDTLSELREWAESARVNDEGER